MLMKKQAAAAAEVVDDGILQQIDAEEAAEIEFERTTMPEDAMHLRTSFRS